jgi:cytochrome b561
MSSDDGNGTAQHWVLMISFVVLVISGFAVSDHGGAAVRAAAKFVIRGTVHRSPQIFMVWTVWHMYLSASVGDDGWRT